MGVVPVCLQEAEVEASQSTDRPFPRIGQELRLDNRCVRTCEAPPGRTLAPQPPEPHSSRGLVLLLV